MLPSPCRGVWEFADRRQADKPLGAINIVGCRTADAPRELVGRDFCFELESGGDGKVFYIACKVFHPPYWPVQRLKPRLTPLGRARA